ncbi:hypothetical protein GALMADRAFT_216023 [Galerina marginata CBS 339.88]|uniref:Uncharacterized protein n=1 Tax=Galerina marginata (strain CBS 339.88) TaxID=685588 RepID=A0A067SB79_GALM3|nr:hypothetical protein GALMADRAFT_216023 [Galerina marginata CBS 339.88]
MRQNTVEFGIFDDTNLIDEADDESRRTTARRGGQGRAGTETSPPGIGRAARRCRRGEDVGDDEPEQQLKEGQMAETRCSSSSKYDGSAVEQATHGLLVDMCLRHCGYGEVGRYELEVDEGEGWVQGVMRSTSRSTMALRRE